ncbi:MAG: TonB-dependent receptor [Acidobacteria bacterium]|nr:TonB-dependent receptor [Acidobacteriota bacterium]
MLRLSPFERLIPLLQLTRISFLLIFFFTCTSFVFAQASSSTAELRGQVFDSTNAVVPGASVVLKDTTKDTVRNTTTDGDGNFIFLAVLPSTYEVTVEASAGFAESKQMVTLTVGAQSTLTFKLSTEAGIEEVVTIESNSGVIEVDRTQQSTVIDARQITNLPIGRRNYIDYAQLTPGVTDSDNIADASDFRVAQTPQSGLSFGGNNGRGNYVAVDGSETNTITGAVIATVSQEAVQEFQVLRNSYSAEFGGAAGGIISIISKSGTKDFHGGIFGYFRNDRLDARNVFDFSPNEKSPFDRQQYGGSLGGPLIKGNTFFFTAFERFDENQTTFVNLLNDPNIFKITPSQTSLFNFLDGTAFSAVSAGLRNALTTSSSLYPNTVKRFQNASGQFPFESHQTNFSSRIDRTFSANDSAYLRFNLNDSFFENQASGALTAVSRGRTIDSFNGNISLSENHLFSPTIVNELKLQYTYLRFEVVPNEQIGPEINIEGFGNFGRDIFLPSTNFERHYDVVDNLSIVKGNHTFKVGGSLLATAVDDFNETFGGGRFNFGANIPLSTIIAANPQLGPTVLNSLTTFLTNNNPALLPALSTPINALQAFNLNLPIVYQQGFGDSSDHGNVFRYGFYAQDTWKVRPNFTLNYGLRYSIDDEALNVPTDTDDIQPRVGFSWSPFSDGKTVIRAGAGIFNGAVIYTVANVTSELAGFGDPTEINIVLATATSGALGLPSSFAVYQSLLSRGILGTRSITAADLAPFGIKPGPGRPLEVRFRLGPNYRTPTTYQASLGVERDLGKGFSLELSYLFTRGQNIARPRDINQFKATGPVSPITGQATFIRFPTPVQAAAGLTSDFRNPLRFQDNVYESTAKSFYNAFTVAVQRRFSNNFSLNAHYTFSKSIDEVTDFNSDFAAQNPLNLTADRALSSFDQRHRAVISGIFVSPIKGDSLTAKLLGDFQIAPIFTAGSGRPFNLLLGFDANGDGRSQSDRPGATGRNTGRGEEFYSFDTRIARRISVKENVYFELTLEAFNLFNRTNFAGINNIIGTTRLTSFDARGDRGKSPTQPLGFTSAAAKRQLQLGVRFTF